MIKSMAVDAQIAGDNLIVQNRTRRNIDTVAVIGNDDHRALQRNILAKRHITGHRQMIQFQHVRNALETIQEIFHLVEVRAQLDQRRRRE